MLTSPPVATLFFYMVDWIPDLIQFLLGVKRCSNLQLLMNTSTSFYGKLPATREESTHDVALQSNFSLVLRARVMMV